MEKNLKDTGKMTIFANMEGILTSEASSSREASKMVFSTEKEGTSALIKLMKEDTIMVIKTALEKRKALMRSMKVILKEIKETGKEHLKCCSLRMYIKETSRTAN